MNKLNKLFLLLALSGLFLMSSCKKKDEPKPAKEVIAISWKVSQVKEDGIVVYSSSATTNTSNYSKFNLAFTATDVTLLEFDGTKFTGKWSLSSTNTVLDLTGLTPTPTDGASIQYTGVIVSEKELKITRVGKNSKTGKSNVEYTLIPQ
ncbi:MAG: hypothetical protein V4714_04390 [Bacteroidota bacterium]